ncbi:MAG: hypothetical protein N3E47_01185 [Candidatus Bathyarchaeota archaeon]|nr:hypothetical protein [Candidatus Bathyarchaeota archaeon]
MLRKSIFRSAAAAVLLTAILLSYASIALAREQSIKVNVHAQAKNGNITVSGKVFLRGLEGDGKISVDIEINVARPDGMIITASFSLIVCGQSRSSGVTIIEYEHTFENCVNEKGIYKIEVAAEYNGLMDKAFFKFDPPTGGTPGVPC